MREFSSQRHKIRYYHSLEGERKIEAFREMVDESGQIAFLGGAGVSTESGIPDFRSKNGLYRKMGSIASFVILIIAGYRDKQVRGIGFNAILGRYLFTGFTKKEKQHKRFWESVLCRFSFIPAVFHATSFL